MKSCFRAHFITHERDEAFLLINTTESTSLPHKATVWLNLNVRTGLNSSPNVRKVFGNLKWSLTVCDKLELPKVCCAVFKIYEQMALLVAEVNTTDAYSAGLISQWTRPPLYCIPWHWAVIGHSVWSWLAHVWHLTGCAHQELPPWGCHNTWHLTSEEHSASHLM